MDTHYYSVSLASGEHLGFLVTVLDGEDQAQASGQAIIKLQPSEEAWLKRPESLSLQALGSYTPLHWQHQQDGIVLQDADANPLTHMSEGYFKWQGFVYVVNDISSVM